MIAADVDLGAIGGKLAGGILRGRASEAHHHLSQIVQRDRRGAADIKDAAMTGGGFGGCDKSLGNVIDIGQIAQLGAAPNLERLLLQHATNPDTEKSLPRVPNAQARAVAIREPQRDNGPTAHAVLDHPILLAGEFRHAVGVGWRDRLAFVHR